jgi:thiamine biosynthesis lipoprotein
MNATQAVERHLSSTRFRALGTDVLIVSPGVDRLSVHDAVAAYERRFSRFLPNSELEQLSSRAGDVVEVSAGMFDVLECAMRFWRETGGIFDPLIRPELEAAGYDRSFAVVARRLPEAAERPALRSFTFGDVQLERERKAVRLPAGARLDLGGIAKGWIVDRVGDLLAPYGPFVVDIGGDIMARGDGPGGEPGWLIGVADPFRIGDDLCWLRPIDAGVATSTTSKRRWRRGGELLHHLIDTRTGRPADSEVVQVTVLAATTMEADIYAKTALILGPDAGVEWLERRLLPGLVVTQDASIPTAAWRDIEVKPTAA